MEGCVPVIVKRGPRVGPHVLEGEWMRYTDLNCEVGSFKRETLGIVKGSEAGEREQALLRDIDRQCKIDSFRYVRFGRYVGNGELRGPEPLEWRWSGRAGCMRLSRSCTPAYSSHRSMP
jgi:hypothetical protein